MSAPVIEYSSLDSKLEPVQSAPHWYIGYSGGLDSSVLLHLLSRWRRAHPGAPPLTAIHINHGMQAGADEWQVHCEWVCRMLHIPLVSRRVTIEKDHAGSEAAAREVRYRVFDELLGEGDMLFLGHHLDDQVETFFLRIMRGAGVRGLAAIPEARALGNGELQRPLLQWSRQQLAEYAAAHGLAFIEDDSNQDTSLDRNFLRAELLPLLATRWPGYRQTVSRASQHMAVAAEVLDELLPSPDTVYSSFGDPGVSLRELQGTSEAAAVKLRGWLRSRGLQAPDQVALKEFLRQLREAGGDSAPRLQCRSYDLQRYRGAVYRLPAALSQSLPESVSLVPGEVRDIPGVGQLVLEPVDGPGLALESGESVEVGWRNGGERCQPAGRSAASSLKKLLQEADVPTWWRDRVPLLFLDGEMLAAGELWLCESSRFARQRADDEPLWRLCWRRPEEPAGD